jgi:hypothetical protein
MFLLCRLIASVASTKHIAFCIRPEVHKISARVQCTVQVCELAVSNLHAAPYRSTQIICLSHSEQLRALTATAAVIPSPATCRAAPSRARHSTTHHRTLCAVHGLCTSALDFNGCLYTKQCRIWTDLLLTNYTPCRQLETELNRRKERWECVCVHMALRTCKPMITFELIDDFSMCKLVKWDDL